MYQENIVLCSASKYAQKYYLNEDFEGLPDLVKQELQIMCVLFTEDVGGVIILEFDEEGSLQIKTEAYEEDILYVESFLHYIVIHTKDKEYKIKENISAFQEKLHISQFLRI